MVKKVDNKFLNLYENHEIADKVLFDDTAISRLETNQMELYNLSYNHLFEILDKDENVIEAFPLKREYPSEFHIC